MKKIILWGDGLLAGPQGFADLLIQHIFLHHPKADVSTSIYGGANETWLEISRDVPLHVIGKAPDLVVFGFGICDILAGKSPKEVVDQALVSIQMALHKTQAKVCLLSLMSSFVENGPMREATETLNQLFLAMHSDRIAFIDLENRVQRFLVQHRESPGEKHALHLDSQRLTPLGRLLLAHHAFHMIEWPQFDAA